MNKKTILKHSHINAYMDFNSRLSIGGDYIKQKSNKTKYCDRCKKEKQLEWQRESMQNIRNFNM
ncbi:hypothetical protein [Clostridium tepidum]|uniref:hypothetical protein n=1 Tax=Clostridium tepidum TaxID=1962263 RepID=UPI001180F421|nr:hypothetical protein [Clostridium tepidum]